MPCLIATGPQRAKDRVQETDHRFSAAILSYKVPADGNDSALSTRLSVNALFLQVIVQTPQPRHLVSSMAQSLPFLSTVIAPKKHLFAHFPQ